MIEQIALWHHRACPTPDQRAFDVQLGCHFEEIVEMLDSIEIPEGANTLAEARDAMGALASWLKAGDVSATITNRRDFLDAAADQIVTSVGAAYRARMEIGEAVARVNRSNWSKYDENGQPIFDENGKVKKGPNYQAPDLTGLY